MRYILKYFETQLALMSNVKWLLSGKSVCVSVW